MMKKNNGTYVYLVEGETEEKMVRILKESYIFSGKTLILHQQKISSALLRMLPRDSYVVIIFDTDVPETRDNLDITLQRLKNSGLNALLIPQIQNLEDEIIYSTSIKKITELLDSKSSSDFKRDFLKEKNTLKKLKDKDFDIKKFWSRIADENSVFGQYKNDAHKIKR